MKAEQKKILEGLDFSEISISSSITLTDAAVPAGAFTLPDVPGIGTVIELAQGQKCERCWQVLGEVGKHADHPMLCNRCHDAVVFLGKKAGMILRHLHHNRLKSPSIWWPSSRFAISSPKAGLSITSLFIAI